MKYKASVIIAGLILVALSMTFLIGYKPVEVSELENRRMTTFDMIFSPETNPQSEIYNAEKSHTDRFEDALKDQIAIRDTVVTFYSTLEGRFANIYNRAFLALRGLSSNLNNNNNEDDPTTDTADTEEPIVEVEPDYDTYPLYGFQRLELPKKQDYTLLSLGQEFYRINDTDYVGKAPITQELVYEDEGALDLSITHLKMLHFKYPDIKMYTYFVRQACDTPWFDDFLGTPSYDRFEFVTRYLPEYIKYDQFIFNDFEEYKEVAFASDHHWNYNGTRRGYEDIYAMMAEDLNLSPIKEPIKTWNFSELFGVKFYGSYAQKLLSAYEVYDDFIVHEYDLGERDCYAINPDKTSQETPIRLALWDEYKVGKIDQKAYYDHYINFYGTSTDLKNPKKTYADSNRIYRIENKSDDVEHKLLWIGDSTQRSIRDVLATHFKTVIYIDYRIMNKVEIDKIIDKYEIDTLLIGSLPQSYWYDKWQYKFKFSKDFYK